MRGSPQLLTTGMALVAALGCKKPSEGQRGQESQPVKAREAGDEAAAKAESSATEEGSAQAEPPPPEPPWTLPADYMQFEAACTPGRRITLAFAGDLLLHRELQTQAYAADEGVAALWPDLADLLAEPDLTYLNLEGPMARNLDRDLIELPDPGRVFDRVIYTGYPRFNYHPSVAEDLVKAGVDVVSTANNHALDRGAIGADLTIEALRKAKLAHFGTREQDGPERWFAITKVGDLSIGWVACTRHTNQIPDELDQVLECGTGRGVRHVIRALRGRRPKVDALIVTPHWGKEYSHEVRERQRRLARMWIEAGATAVIGSHPHVVQPWEKIVTEDGREGLALYSLGNFASHQPELSRRTSLLLYLTLVEGEDGELRIAGTRYLPLHVRREGEAFFVEAIDRSGGRIGEGVHDGVEDLPQARALMVALLGPGNLVTPDEPKLADPHCDEDWRPHPIPTWAELDEPFVIPGTEAEGETEGPVDEGESGGDEGE